MAPQLRGIGTRSTRTRVRFEDEIERTAQLAREQTATKKKNRKKAAPKTAGRKKKA
ncbi:hypothetical protein P152DRAFT_459488, partial [Eremomyces bilateralis CBS 781.70]